jgi:hypothetical protein
MIQTNVLVIKLIGINLDIEPKVIISPRGSAKKQGTKEYYAIKTKAVKE